jgi:plastocyanin domain-containing protein
MKNARPVIFLLSFIVLACSMAFAADPEIQPYVAAISSTGVQTIDMVATEFAFTPKAIIVKVNVPVELTIRREPSLVPHTIVMKSPEAGMDFRESIPVEPTVIKFTPTKLGKYSFYCDKSGLFKNHRDLGMEGVLEVRE